MEPTNLAEYIMGYILAFGWLMMQNSFIGILCGSIADGDRHAKEYAATTASPMQQRIFL